MPSIHHKHTHPAALPQPGASQPALGISTKRMETELLLAARTDPDAVSLNPPRALTLRVLLRDALRPYERGQTPDIPFKHAFVDREVQTGPDHRGRRVQAAGSGVALCVLLLRGRRLDQLVVTEHSTGSALVARPGGGERAGRSLFVRLQQAPILARPAVLAVRAYLLPGHSPPDTLGGERRGRRRRR